jgi:UTP--glucose-1-phosphate uridylyltransferase
LYNGVEQQMKVRKAILTAAGRNQRRLPLQSLVDRDGVSRTVLAILINDILEADIEEIGVVVWPGDEALFREAAPESHAGLLRFFEQRDPRGYGDALFRAAEFSGGEPVLHLVGDHLYLGPDGRGCGAREIVALAEAEECCVSAVRATHERSLSSFGCVGGQPAGNRPGVYRVDRVAEKPTPTFAEQELIVAGLRAGHYLAFFGMHVLTPAVFGTLERLLRETSSGRVLLSDALAELAGREKYLALQVDAERYDLGSTYGLLAAQLALSLAGKDREEILALMVNLLAGKSQRESSR